MNTTLNKDRGNKNLFDTTIIGLIVVMALSRLIPHWPNVTPLMAMAVFGGSFFANRTKSIVVTLCAMLLSDVALAFALGWDYGFHSTQLPVYAMLVVACLLGSFYKSSSTVQKVFVGGTLSSILFFLVTNFAVWAGGTMYPHDMSGLMQSYAAGLAFYRDGGNFFLNGLVSTWAYMGLMIGLTALARKRMVATA